MVTEISERVSGLYNHPEGVAAAFIEHTRTLSECSLRALINHAARENLNNKPFRRNPFITVIADVIRSRSTAVRALAAVSCVGCSPGRDIRRYLTKEFRYRSYR